VAFVEGHGMEGVARGTGRRRSLRTASFCRAFISSVLRALAPSSSGYTGRQAEEEGRKGRTEAAKLTPGLAGRLGQ